MHGTSGGGDPLYVPEEFEEEYLDEARRRIARSARRRRVLRRRSPARARWRDASPRQRLVRVVGVLHALAATLAVALSAVTGTWLVGLMVVLLVALSFGGVVRVIHLIDAAREAEATVERRGRHD